MRDAGIGGSTSGGTFPTRGGLRVTCGNCHRPFSIPPPQIYRPNAFEAAFVNRLVTCLSGGAAPNVSGLIAARCPQCHKITSIGQAYARTRWVGSLILTLILLIIAVGVTIGTSAAAKTQHGLYFLWSGWFPLSLFITWDLAAHLYYNGAVCLFI